MAADKIHKNHSERNRTSKALNLPWETAGVNKIQDPPFWLWSPESKQVKQRLKGQEPFQRNEMVKSKNKNKNHHQQQPCFLTLLNFNKKKDRGGRIYGVTLASLVRKLCLSLTKSGALNILSPILVLWIICLQCPSEGRKSRDKGGGILSLLLYVNQILKILGYMTFLQAAIAWESYLPGTSSASTKVGRGFFYSRKPHTNQVLKLNTKDYA